MGPVTGLQDNDDIPAAKVYSYMYKYCEKFSLLERTRLSTTVTKISRDSDTPEWKVRIKPSDATLICDKLLVATGLASIPNWPDIPIDTFTGPVMHSRDIGKRHSELISEKVKRVTVLGGCKSALDIVMACSAAGKKVDWVIRATGDGNGPGMMVQSEKVGSTQACSWGAGSHSSLPQSFQLLGFGTITCTVTRIGSGHGCRGRCGKRWVVRRLEWSHTRQNLRISASCILRLIVPCGRLLQLMLCMAMRSSWASCMRGSISRFIENLSLRCRDLRSICRMV